MDCRVRAEYAESAVDRGEDGYELKRRPIGGLFYILCGLHKRLLRCLDLLLVALDLGLTLLDLLLESLSQNSMSDCNALRCAR